MPTLVHVRNALRAAIPVVLACSTVGALLVAPARSAVADTTVDTVPVSTEPVEPASAVPASTEPVEPASAVPVPVSVSASHVGSRPVGVLTRVWGRVSGHSGGRVFTQVQVAGVWRTSQIVSSDATGYYQIPLTYGATQAGTLTWRVGANTQAGTVVYSAPFQFTRTAVPVTVSASSAGSASAGALARVWGRVNGHTGGRVFTQVQVAGVWRRSQIVSSDSTGYYQIPLTYGATQAGTYRWRVGASVPGGGTVYSAPFQFTRNARPTPPPVGACQDMGLATPNRWRANEGVRSLSRSAGLYSGACAWATHLARTDTLRHQRGNYGEVAVQAWGNCSSLWSYWFNSRDHYRLIVSNRMSVAAFACVQRSNGKVWAVGRTN